MSGCDSNDPTGSSFTAVFYPDTSTPPANSISMQAARNNAQRIHISVHAQDISNGKVFGAAFDLQFRPVILEYIGYEPGEFLESSGRQVLYQVAVEDGNPGRLIVGISLVGDAEGVTGTGALITLKFKAIAADISPMTFSNNVLLDNTPPGGNPITGIAWYAGRAQVD